MKTNGTGTNAGKSVIKFEEYIGETKKAEKEILLTKDESETSKYTFSINLPITDGLDGDITYKVSAQDKNNKDITGITEFTVNRDITAPVINVTTPSAATFGDSSISTETAVFRGDITELNPQSIFYQKKKANETAPTALTTANVLAGNIGEWITGDISKLGVDGDGNGSWNFTTSFDSTPATRDGKWKLYIQSADKGGNICNMQTIDFCVDSAAPEIIVNIKNDESETPITATLDGSATIAVLSGSKYTISGTAKDTNGLKSFTINNSSVTVNTDGTWSLPEVTEEGITEYKIVAIDNSGNGLTGTSKIEGKITQVDKSVIFDLNNPDATITTLPSDNTWITGTGNVYIRGSASDASGIKDITVKINNSAAETIAVSDPWTYTLDYSKLSENDKTESSVHTMVVTVTDNCNKPTTITRKFKLDKTTPVLSNIVAADSKTKTKYTNNITDVVIEGFAYDGAQSNKRPVDKVIISAKDKDGNVVDLHQESESETENVVTDEDVDSSIY